MIVVRRIRPRPNTRRQSDIESLYQTLLTGGGAAERNRRHVWRPPFEVYETADALEVVAEIAGMNGDDVDIVLEGDVLTIQGDRPDPGKCQQRSYHIARIGYGSFAVEISLPFQVEVEAATADYENGFLRVSLPRAKGRTIVPTRGASNLDA